MTRVLFTFCGLQAAIEKLAEMNAKRKAASKAASGQPTNKLSPSKGKQVPGTPLDTDQEAHEVLRATAPSLKVCMCISGSLAWLCWHLRDPVAQAFSSAIIIICRWTCAILCASLVQAVMQSMQCCAALTILVHAGCDATARPLWPAPAQALCCPVE